RDTRSSLSPVPHRSGPVHGLMSLRARLSPVVVLRVKFGVPETEYNRFAVVIVVAASSKVVGLLADCVTDVLTLAKTNVQAAPDFGTPIEAGLISGMAKAGEKVVILLDVEHLLEGDATSGPRGPR